MTKLLTVKDLAERYSVTEKQVRKWSRDGSLPPPVNSPGRQLHWKEQEIEAMEREKSIYP